jgi:hypothetical protein
MNYRPITDTWICARPKVPYYGAYPAGFLERARALLGVRYYEPVLHVCGGQAREYSALNRGVKPGIPLFGFGPFDMTLDAAGSADYIADVTEVDWVQQMQEHIARRAVPFAAILVDPPYTVEDADHYPPGRELFPSAKQLLADCLQLVPVWHRVGMLHYLWPRPPKTLDVRCVANISVDMGYDNRKRCYSVYERRS